MFVDLLLHGVAKSSFYEERESVAHHLQPKKYKILIERGTGQIYFNVHNSQMIKSN